MSLLDSVYYSKAMCTYPGTYPCSPPPLMARAVADSIGRYTFISAADVPLLVGTACNCVFSVITLLLLLMGTFFEHGGL